MVTMVKPVTKVNKRQVIFSLAFITLAYCLFNVELVSTKKASSSLETNGVFKQPDGSLLIPVGNIKGRSRGQNLQGKVGGTRQKMCAHLLAERDQRQRTITRLHLKADLCGDFSIGNMIPNVLSYNLAAHLADIPFTFSCTKSEPSVMALMQKREEFPFLPNDYSEGYTLEKFCGVEGVRFEDTPHGHHEIEEFQDMPHAHYLITETMRHQIASSRYASKDADDAVIHLRLHDAFKPILKTESQRGLFSHVTYSTLLKKAEQEKGEIRSISIVTATFHKAKLRDNDKEFADISKIVGRDLARHLNEVFPNAKVLIRNEWDTETTVVSYSRLVHAKKVAICGCSTFCAFPVVSVEDDVLAYIYDSKYLNPFNGYFAQSKVNIHLWDAPMLGSNKMHGFTEEQILEFVRNPDDNNIRISL